MSRPPASQFRHRRKHGFKGREGGTITLHSVVDGDGCRITILLGLGFVPRQEAGLQKSAKRYLPPRRADPIEASRASPDSSSWYPDRRDQLRTRHPVRRQRVGAWVRCPRCNSPLRRTRYPELADIGLRTSVGAIWWRLAPALNLRLAPTHFANVRSS